MGNVLGVFLGPHEDFGGGFRVGMVLGRDFRMTMVPHAGCIYGTDQRRSVQPGRRYPIQEIHGRGRVKYDGMEQKERGAVQHGIWPLCGLNFSGRGCAAVLWQRLGGS